MPTLLRHRLLWSMRLGLWALATLLPRASSAQSVEADLGAQVFYEPSVFSKMTVITPRLSLTALPSDYWRISAGYSADIVSGASEAIKAGPLLREQPDIVSQASVTDLRHVANAAVAVVREHTRFEAGYSYGVEKDYRSHSFTVTGVTDLLQRNTEIGVSYAHGFDEVCNLRQPGLAATLRQRLDSSQGCFTQADRVVADDISLDNVQFNWSQSWTPVFITQLSVSGSIQHGFLGNPYRDVVIGPTGQAAQEHHPEDRARAAASLRLKYYLRSLKSALGGSVRAYGDSWDVLSHSYELEAERYLSSWLRLRVHGRYYAQSGALFWSDDYTGGEPAFGARGQYWSGDRELSPLKSVLVGGRFLADFRGAPNQRLAGMLLSLQAGLSLDVMKTFLEDFTWAGRDPDDTLALIPALSVGGTF